MKYILIVLSAVTLLALASCGGEKPNRPDPVLTQDQINAQNAKFDAPEIPAGGAVAGGVKHYTCPNGHAGADTQGNCVICGTALQHNQAFHDQPAAAAGAGAEAGTEPPQNADGVWHYTCPNGHPGGGGGATPCPVCGTVMVHNTEYHSGNAATPAATTATTDPMAVPPAPAASAEPPQNAAGVWHYTCPNGHEGGGGGATPCSVCGTTLVHNTAYHN